MDLCIAGTLYRMMRWYNQGIKNLDKADKNQALHFQNIAKDNYRRKFRLELEISDWHKDMYKNCGHEKFSLKVDNHIGCGMFRSNIGSLLNCTYTNRIFLKECLVYLKQEVNRMRISKLHPNKESGSLGIKSRSIV